MQKEVSKFAGKNTSFDLKIVVRDIQGYGELDSVPGINTFYMGLDEEGILQRKFIETAALFLHEAMAVKYRALAWHGLSDTDYYKNSLTDNEKQAIVDNRRSALYKSTDSCNQ